MNKYKDLLKIAQLSNTGNTKLAIQLLKGKGYHEDTYPFFMRSFTYSQVIEVAESVTIKDKVYTHPLTTDKDIYDMAMLLKTIHDKNME